MIKFTLLGGPFESETGVAKALGDRIVRIGPETVEHAYVNLNGSWFMHGPGGTRQDEEAYFFHPSLVALGEAKAMTYAEMAGY